MELRVLLKDKTRDADAAADALKSARAQLATQRAEYASLRGEYNSALADAAAAAAASGSTAESLAAAAATTAAAEAEAAAATGKLAALEAAMATRETDVQRALGEKVRDDEVIRTLTDELCELQNGLRTRSADLKTHEVKKERLYRMVNEISAQRDTLATRVAAMEETTVDLTTQLKAVLNNDGSGSGSGGSVAASEDDTTSVRAALQLQMESLRAANDKKRLDHLRGRKSVSFLPNPPCKQLTASPDDQASRKTTTPTSSSKLVPRHQKLQVMDYVAQKRSPKSVSQLTATMSAPIIATTTKTTMTATTTTTTAAAAATPLTRSRAALTTPAVTSSSSSVTSSSLPPSALATPTLSMRAAHTQDLFKQSQLKQKPTPMTTSSTSLSSSSSSSMTSNSQPLTMSTRQLAAGGFTCKSASAASSLASAVTTRQARQRRRSMVIVRSAGGVVGADNGFINSEQSAVATPFDTTDTAVNCGVDEPVKRAPRPQRRKSMSAASLRITVNEQS
jgi:hypothetical protein